MFVPPAYLPTESQELDEYNLHQNSEHDAGYCQFLNKIADPLLQHITPGQYGLDFGCGPAPVLATILEKAGMHMRVYDPLFYPDSEVLTGQYDFITCTEAIEHFHHPADELAVLNKLLAPGGWLAIMTKRVISRTRFASWHYKNDLTHVCFFSEASFEYIGRKFGFSVSFPGTDTVLMQKNT
ncbi:class I SAM-dependent methyltransferase [Alteromonas halophila]|uniref:Methyltransferase n=1 Tax=Alteromonas halophila TaxID=516698 RepID=A0A918JRU8_9ALTE|nr:class I SAM-dependent methyltransferase [Alteromonas halophila]GGW96308.1 methyltransferase [Alteromonas halophila]